jgi:hypothetical protein
MLKAEVGNVKKSLWMDALPVVCLAHGGPVELLGLRFHKAAGAAFQRPAEATTTG